MNEENEVEQVIVAAANLLSRTLGRTVTLLEQRRFTDTRYKNLVLRCSTNVNEDGFPDTVIVKRAMPGVLEYAEELLADRASMSFLAGVAHEQPFAPHVYAGDEDDGMLVIEDLRGGNLYETLEGRDRTEAERALKDLASLLGKMHFAARDQQAEFVQTCEQIGAPAESVFPGMPDRVAGTLQQAREDLLHLGVITPVRFDREVDGLLESLQNPGPFLTFTHTDTHPANCIRVPGEIRLIDFARGGFRHALLDAAYAHMLFPTSARPGLLPGGLLEQMEHIYRSELASAVREAEDDRLFDLEFTRACAFWALLALIQFREWGQATLAQWQVAMFEMLERTAGARHCLPAIQHVVHETLHQLRARNEGNEVAIGLYPVFQQEPADVKRLTSRDPGH